MPCLNPCWLAQLFFYKHNIITPWKWSRALPDVEFKIILCMRPICYSIQTHSFCTHRFRSVCCQLLTARNLWCTQILFSDGKRKIGLGKRLCNWFFCFIPIQLACGEATVVVVVVLEEAEEDVGVMCSNEDIRISTRSGPIFSYHLRSI